MPRRVTATPRPFPPRAWWVVIAALGVAIVSISAPLEAVVAGVAPPLALAAGVVQAGSIALAAVTPRIAIAFHLFALATVQLGATTTGVAWPVSVIALIVFSLFLAVLALARRTTPAIAAWLLGLAMSGVIALLVAGRWVDAPASLIDLTVAAAVSALALVAALAVAARLNVDEELASARRTVEVEQDRRRAGEERARIAREMHDVVAHSMSAVVMRATSAPYRLPALDEPARDEFAAIADSARSALGELRQVLSVLRSSDQTPTLAPQPSLADLEGLLAGARDAGLRVTSRSVGNTARVPDVVQLAAYRIVQEALSNAIRHAHDSTVEVDVVALPGEVHIDVVDDGAGSTEPVVAPGGHGLVGMRERVDSLGGTMSAGPEAGGGFRVSVKLPYEPTGEGTA